MGIDSAFALHSSPFAAVVIGFPSFIEERLHGHNLDVPSQFSEAKTAFS